MLQPIKPKPGVVKDSTNLNVGEAFWVDADKVRFHHGSPETIGGWSKLLVTQLSGTPRAIHSWNSNNGDDYGAICTVNKVYIYYNNTFSDITPYRLRDVILGLSTTPGTHNNPIATVDTSTTLTITMSAHGAITGAKLIFLSTTAFNGADVVAGTEYTITYIDANSFSIVANDAATSTGATGGANVRAHFLMNPISGTIFTGTGYGVGNYGGGEYGTGTQVSLAYSSGMFTVDNWGEDFVFAQRFGRAYIWDTSTGVTDRAVNLYYAEQILHASTAITTVNTSADVTITTAAANAAAVGDIAIIRGTTGNVNKCLIQGEFVIKSITNSTQFVVTAPMAADAAGTGGGTDMVVQLMNAPRQVGILIVSPDRHLILYGSNPVNTTSTEETFSPRHIRWSNQNDLTAWRATSTNTAGSKTIHAGSSINCARIANAQILFWTDVALWAQQFIGPPFTFQIQQIGENCGTLGPQSAITVGGRAFWWGRRNFYSYDGSINIIQNPLSDSIFDNLVTAQVDKFVANTIAEFNEIIFLYQVGATDLDRYVLFNWKENHWSPGTIARSTWHDTLVLNNIIAADPDGYVYEHETGLTADGSALSAYVESGSFQLGEGDTFQFIDTIIPDFALSTNGTVQVTLYLRRYPEDSEEITKGPYSVNDTIKKVNIRARGREFRIRLASNASNTSWKMGRLRLNIQPDGRR